MGESVGGRCGLREQRLVCSDHADLVGDELLELAGRNPGVAPGVDVVSAAPGGGYQAMNGTSMATPHVAGLAALLMEAAPNASIDDVERAIFRSCDRPAGMPRSRGNRGIPDAEVALADLGT